MRRIPVAIIQPGERFSLIGNRGLDIRWVLGIRA
jgi:hypothetical protein